MDTQEKGQAVANFAVGGAAFSSPAWMHLMSDATSTLQFATSLGGFLLLCYQIHKTIKKGNKKNVKSPRTSTRNQRK